MALASDIIRRVRHLISDETNATISGYRWTDADLLKWISEAQRQIVSLKPEANIYTRGFTPEPDVSRQLLNTGALIEEVVGEALVPYRLVRVEANCTSAGDGGGGGTPNMTAQNIIIGTDELGGLGYSTIIGEATAWGLWIGAQPLAGHTVRVATDTKLTPIINGFFGVLGFLLVLDSDSSTTAPAANVFTSATINGHTYLAADCVDVGDAYLMECMQSVPPRPTAPFASETGVDTAFGESRRWWFWPTPAGLVDGTNYELVIT